MTEHFTCKVPLGVSQLASVIQSTVVLNNPNNLIEVLCATLLDSGANDLSVLFIAIAHRDDQWQGDFAFREVISDVLAQ